MKFSILSDEDYALARSAEWEEVAKEYESNIKVIGADRAEAIYSARCIELNILFNKEDRRRDVD